jgi:ketosteroid isomerase-like protein
VTRTPQEIFTAHGDALNAGDRDKILEDYADDAVLLTADGALEGRDAISSFFAGALSALPGVRFTFGTTVYSGDALLLRWTASSPQGRIDDGVDTFVFADGKIRLQTAVFSVTPAG